MESKKALLAVIFMTLLAGPAAARDWDRIGGDASGITQRFAVAVTNQDAWNRIWKAHTSGFEPAAPAPKVEFDKEIVVAVFLGSRMSGGWTIETETRKAAKAAGLVVAYRAKAPEKKKMFITQVTQPFVLVKMKRPAGTVTVENADGPKIKKDFSAFVPPFD